MVTTDTFYPSGYGCAYKVSGFFGRKKERWNSIFMISDRCNFSTAGMLLAVSETVKKIGFPLPWVGADDAGGGIYYKGIGHGPG